MTNDNKLHILRSESVYKKRSPFNARELQLWVISSGFHNSCYVSIFLSCWCRKELMSMFAQQGSQNTMLESKASRCGGGSRKRFTQRVQKDSNTKRQRAMGPAPIRIRSSKIFRSCSWSWIRRQAPTRSCSADWPHFAGHNRSIFDIDTWGEVLEQCVKQIQFFMASLFEKVW